MTLGNIAKERSVKKEGHKDEKQSGGEEFAFEQLSCLKKSFN